MTMHTAQQMGIAAAHEAYRQWDWADAPTELVMRHCDKLYAALAAEGLTPEDDGDLLDNAGLCFRVEAEFLFGADYVVVG